MKEFLRKIAGLMILLAIAAPEVARAEGKVALVIGNGAYRSMPSLRNPANDARLIAGKLSGLGFDVVEVVDGTRKDFREGLTRFGRQAQDADVALVFYAGHGVQVNGQNWLLPVDSDIEAATDLAAQALRADDIVDIMEVSGARLKLVFLDACRNNPLPRSLSRGADRGLARLEANAAGMMIAFATSPGDVAQDGTGANSPFTEALARLIDTPDLEVRHLMGKVRESVYTSTGERQLPWLNEALIGEFYFGGQSGAQAGGQAGNQPVAAPAASPENQQTASAAAVVPVRTQPQHLPVPRYAGNLCGPVSVSGGGLTVCASSVLDPQYGNRYGPANLFDGKTSTAWVEGVSGNGAGQKVLIDFGHPRLLSGFQVVNGYAKNRDIYTKNARVRTATLRLSDGSSQTINLLDDMRADRISFGTPLEASWMELEIDTVFNGSKYTDTALSELVPLFAD